MVMLGGNHRTDWFTTFPFGHIYADELGSAAVPGHPSSNGGVTIGHDVWIGRDVTIMSGVTIGNGAVIAANSHVVKDVGDYEIVGGNPARLIKKRFDDDVIRELLALQWWNAPLDFIRRHIVTLSSVPTVASVRELASQLRALETVDAGGGSGRAVP